MLLKTWAGGGVLDALHEFDRLERQMGHVFGDRIFHGTDAWPELNIHKGESGIRITAFVPGIDPDKVNIQVTGDTLNLKGELAGEEEAVYHRRERRAGNFDRTVKLPFRAEADKVEAHYTNGLLTIFVAKPEEEQPRQIKVNIA